MCSLPVRAYQMWPIDESNLAELTSRMEVYISEFEKNGTDNVTVDMET